MLRPCILAICITIGVAGCATTQSPTGRKQQTGAISPDQLNQLGAKSFAEYKAKVPQSKDAQKNTYVRCVVNQLVQQLPTQMQAMQWETVVFENNEVNAFALPGGKVGVYTGIFKAAQNQDQLAAVLAHEIGHVVANHHDERITRQMRAQASVELMSALLGAAYGDQMTAASSNLNSTLATSFFILPGSRTQETEADVVGQQLMSQAGFDPRQAVSLWQNMQQVSTNSVPQFFSTHPNHATRIGELQGRANGLLPVYEQARSAGKRPSCG